MSMIINQVTIKITMKCLKIECCDETLLYIEFFSIGITIEITIIVGLIKYLYKRHD